MSLGKRNQNRSSIRSSPVSGCDVTTGWGCDVLKMLLRVDDDVSRDYGFFKNEINLLTEQNYGGHC